MMTGKDNIYIGTSGYSYKHWTNGVFYPPGMKSTEFLSFYSQHFRTVELNVSFYRLVKLEYLQKWAKITPDDFHFVAKLNRAVTHYAKLRNCEAQLLANKILRDGLGDKLRIILVQLPPSLYFDYDLLKSFLDMTKKPANDWLPKLTFEFRHPSWLTNRTYELLDEYNCALCLTDWKSCTPQEPNNADFVYIRRHGPSGKYAGCYSREHLRADARKICKYLNSGKSVYVFFNNDIKGYAVKNAFELIELLS